MESQTDAAVGVCGIMIALPPGRNDPSNTSGCPGWCNERDGIRVHEAARDRFEARVEATTRAGARTRARIRVSRDDAVDKPSASRVNAVAGA
jgi:hypothetical protein